MPYYTYKNSKIQLNGLPVLVRGAAIDYNAEIAPSYNFKDRNTSEHRPNNGIAGSLQFNYLLTGEDFVKEFIYDEGGSISGNFGGLFFQSGFLSSYQFSATPASPVSVNAQIIFFDELKGTFQPTFEEAQSSNILNFSDAQVSDSFSSGIGHLGSIQKANFNYNSNVEPVYVVGEKTPREVRFGQKTINAQVEIDNLSGDLSIFGNQSALQLNLKDPKSQIVKESFTANGKLEKKSIQVQANQPLTTALSIKQNRVSREPQITSFIPTTFFEGSEITINGTNLHGTRQVTFGGVDGTLVSVSRSQIVAKVPFGAGIDFPFITVLGSDGVSNSPSAYDLQFQPMTATLAASNVTGAISNTLDIDGTNFSRISSVKFGPNNSVLSPTFEVLNTTKIKAEIPLTADVGTISIVSDKKELTATTSETFFPQPSITGCAPKIITQAGQTLSLKGSAFTDVNGVTINSIAVPFSISDSYNIVITAPDQDIEGKIRATDTKGNFGESDFEITQPPIITGFKNGSTAGIQPRVNEILFISGSNFYPSKFDNDAGTDSATVLFGGLANNELPEVKAVFGVVSNSGITGTIPNNARDGFVSLFKPDLTNSHVSGLNIELIEAPGTITNIGAPGTIGPIIF